MIKANRFSRKLMYGMVVLTGMIFIVFILVQYQSDYQQRNRDLDHSMEVYMTSQMERLQTIDQLYYGIEKSIDPRLEKILKDMRAAYERAGHIEFDLMQFIASDPALDAFIIDENNVIIRSTDKIDLGLDFGESPFLDEVRRNGIYNSERLTYQTRTAAVKKYSYLSSQDRKYVFEVGYDMDAFSDITSEDALQSYTSTALEYDENLLGIHLYSYHLGRSFNTGQNLNVVASDEMIAAFEAAKTSRDSIVHVEEVEGYDHKHLFRVFERDIDGEALPFLVVDLVYTNRFINTELRNTLLYRIFLIVIVMVLAIMAQWFVNHNFIMPVNRLLEGMKELKSKNFQVRLSLKSIYKEIVDAGLTFNDTVSAIEGMILEEEKHNRLLKAALDSNKRNYFETIRSLVNTIDAKDKYTAGHCDRVTRLTMILADHLGLDDQTQEVLLFGSTLHDIGKIGIGDQILNKNGRLTLEEYEVIKGHPEIGFNIIKDISFIDEAKSIIHYHHERFDGKGYPKGLKGEAIPYLARIVAITDAFDAMTSKRVYRTHRMTVQQAFEELTSNAGSQFDPNLVEAFILAYQKVFGSDVDRKADLIEIV